jgi:hypothetical protein
MNVTATSDCRLKSQMNFTNLAHLDLTVCLVQDPAYNHAHEVRPEAGPWLVVDLIKQGQWVIHTTTSKITQMVTRVV